MTRSDLLCAFDGGDDCRPWRTVSENTEHRHSNVWLLMHGNLLNAKSSIQFPTWNIWTIYQTAKLAQLLGELERIRALISLRPIGWPIWGSSPPSDIEPTLLASCLGQNHLCTPTRHVCEADLHSNLCAKICAQISKARQAFSHMIRPNGSASQTNDNGMQFLTFYAAQGLVVHKVTWKAPVGCAMRSTMSEFLTIAPRLSLTCKVLGAPMLVLTTSCSSQHADFDYDARLWTKNFWCHTTLRPGRIAAVQCCGPKKAMNYCPTMANVTSASGLIRKGLRHNPKSSGSSPSGSSASIKDWDGRVLPTQEEREHQWVEHLKKAPNQSTATIAFIPDLLNSIPDLPPWHDHSGKNEKCNLGTQEWQGCKPGQDPAWTTLLSDS